MWRVHTSAWCGRLGRPHSPCRAYTADRRCAAATARNASRSPARRSGGSDPGSTRLSAGRPSAQAGGVVLEPDRATPSRTPRAARPPVSAVQPAGLLRRDQPVDRARDRDPVRQRVEAGEVRDRQCAADLQVDAPVAVGDDLAAPARGRPSSRSPSAPGARGSRDGAARRARPPRAAATMSRPPPTWRKSKLTAARTRCERSGCSRHCSNTAFHALCDIRQRGSRARTSAWSSPMPLRASAALTSAATRPKNASAVRARLVGVGERVVLVGGERQLAPRDAAEREPRPRDRRRAVAVEGEVDQPQRRGVGLDGERTRDVRRRQPGREQRRQQPRQPGLQRRDERVLVGRPRDRAAQRERRVLTAGDVLDAEQADDAPVAPGHAELAAVGVEQVDERLGRRSARPARVSAGRRATRTGSSAERPSASTRSRRSRSVTIADAVAGLDERGASVCAAVIAAAASRTGVSAATNTGGRPTSAPSRVMPSSGRPWAVWPERTSRRRRLEREVLGPGRLGEHAQRGRARQRRTVVAASRAWTVNAGARPVSSDGWPKHCPGSSTSTTGPGVDEVHRAGGHDEERVGRRAVLDEHVRLRRPRTGRRPPRRRPPARPRRGRRTADGGRGTPRSAAGLVRTVWSTTRRTGTRARRRTRYGSW